uniref:SAP domain-containing protein n=1 Tax=Glossina pallidipes TaxID=7398 RepID=A0A1B0AEE4_GLOPL
MQPCQAYSNLKKGLKAKLSELGLRTNERKGALRNRELDHYELNTMGSPSDYNEAASTTVNIDNTVIETKQSFLKNNAKYSVNKEKHWNLNNNFEGEVEEGKEESDELIAETTTGIDIPELIAEFGNNSLLIEPPQTIIKSYMSNCTFTSTPLFYLFFDHAYISLIFTIESMNRRKIVQLKLNDEMNYAKN